MKEHKNENKYNNDIGMDHGWTYGTDMVGSTES